ncbi:helix-turn-helix domain-containing protein [Dactylosporangium sp. NPDC050588]|uniref:TetR/AcrR family transcriptional regulator n=1 Tax=Dactylosporangium sp. NPDC050588 TaxID=3157211 RepID=UPI0033CBA2BB
MVYVRADAERNRVRVLEAAEEVLARDGLAVSMRAVAERAGVGLGTIYRHFPTREALLQAIVVERVRRLAESAGPLLAAADPVEAFFAFLTRIVDVSARKKALADAVSGAGLDPKEGLGGIGGDMRAAIEALLLRAQAAGGVRADLRMPELLALLSAACLGAERNQWDDALRDRTLDLIFDGLRAR